ncbi:MAG: hypothetical protein U1E76_01495 [Planctomycetota bacterium]
MRRMPIVLIAVVVVGVVFSARKCGAQQTPGASQQPAVKPETPPAAQPRPQVTTAPQRPTTPATPIADITAYRGDKKAPVVTSENRVRLSLDGINYDAPVLAKVNGEPITQNTFRNRLILSQGFLELEQQLTYILTNRRIEMAVAEGAKKEDFLVTNEEVQKAYEDMKASIPNLAQGMKAEEWEKQVKDFIGLDRYLDMLRVNLSFGKIFLPPIKKKPAAAGAPDAAAAASEEPGLPKHTKELLKPEHVEMLEQQYKQGQELPFIFRDNFVKEIKAELLKKADLKYFWEGGLEDGVFMKVDGEPLFTDQLWSLVAGRIKHADKDLTLREAIVSLAFDQSLRANKAMLSPEESLKLYKQHESTYENTIFPLAFVANLKGFSSLHKYREYYARKCAFTKWLKAQYPDKAFDEQLKAYYYDGPTKLFFEEGRVDSSVLFLSAWDAENNRLKPDGMHAAMDRATQVLDEYRKGASFNDLVKKYSDMTDNAETRKGLIGSKTRYELRRNLGESEYFIYAADYSLAEEIFFCARTDDVLGPVIRDVPEQVSGVFLVKANRFERGTAVSMDAKREQVEQDYIDTSFLNHAHQCLQTAKLELTKG